jgi:hypothetical protein
VALDDYIQVTFTISSAVRDIIFRHLRCCRSRTTTCVIISQRTLSLRTE